MQPTASVVTTGQLFGQRTLSWYVHTISFDVDGSLRLSESSKGDR